MTTRQWPPTDSAPYQCRQRADRMTPQRVIAPFEVIDCCGALVRVPLATRTRQPDGSVSGASHAPWLCS